MSATAQVGFSGPEKGLFRIGEVSRLTNTKQFVLRYWETEFPTLKPVKSPKGHRLYRREDVDTVLRIKRLLYDEGFTIAGARRHLADQPGAAAPADSLLSVAATADAASEVLSEHREAVVIEDSGSSDSFAAAPGRVAEPAISYSEDHVIVERQKLLELRDSLRSFLTLLENE